MGCVPVEELAALVDVLDEWTGTEEACWFAVWEGYGHLQRTDAPVVLLPDRRFFLWRGLLGDAASVPDDTPHTSPNLWWSDRRTWCVATEIDLARTYVGGPQDLIDRILADVRLEAMPSHPSHRFTIHDDHINAALDQQTRP